MRPIRLRSGSKREVRTQFGALCYRMRGSKVEVLLVTSRTRGRWIMPKGWPMNGATPQEAALVEAWEEAGVRGKVRGNALGVYSYTKLNGKDALPCVVAVFAVKVESLADAYPEAKMRQRKWLSRKKAAARLDEPELAQIVRNFSPSQLQA